MRRLALAAMSFAVLTATPALAQTSQEAATTDELKLPATVTDPSLRLQSWTPTLEPLSAADLLIVPVAERLAYATTDSLVVPEPAPMSKGGKIALIAGIIVVVLGGLALVLVATNQG